MNLKPELERKWAPLLDHKGLPGIKDSWRRAVTVVVLENQEREVDRTRHRRFERLEHRVGQARCLVADDHHVVFVEAL